MSPPPHNHRILYTLMWTPFGGQTYILSISLYSSIHKIYNFTCVFVKNSISLSNFFFCSPLGKSIDNSLTQNYQPLEYENPLTAPKFISRGQSYRAVIGDTILLPCATQNLGEKKHFNKSKACPLWFGLPLFATILCVNIFVISSSLLWGFVMPFQHNAFGERMWCREIFSWWALFKKWVIVEKILSPFGEF